MNDKNNHLEKSAEHYLSVFKIMSDVDPTLFPVDSVLKSIYKYYEQRLKEFGHIFSPYPISKRATDEQIRKVNRYYEANAFTKHFYDFFVDSNVNKEKVNYSLSSIKLYKPFDRTYYREKFFIPPIFEEDWYVIDFFKAEIDKKCNEIINKQNTKGK